MAHSREILGEAATHGRKGKQCTIVPLFLQVILLKAMPCLACLKIGRALP